MGFRSLSASSLAIAAPLSDGASMGSEASAVGTACSASTSAISRSPASGVGVETVAELEAGTAAFTLGISAMTRALLSSMAGPMLSTGASVVYATPGSGEDVGTA